MKKYASLLFLLICLLPVFANRQVAFIEKTAATVLVRQSAVSLAVADADFPFMAMQGGSIDAAGAFIQRTQKPIVSISYPGRRPAIDPAFLKITSFPLAKWPGHKYLSYNYPSHHFW